MKGEKRILILGGTGQLGSDLAVQLKKQGHTVDCWGREDFNYENVAFYVKLFDNYHTVINCVAMHDVKKCNLRVVNGTAKAMLYNTIIPSWHAEYLRNSKTQYFFISSDMAMKPSEAYGKSKKKGEDIVKRNGGVVVRVSHLFGKTGCKSKGHHHNFVEFCKKSHANFLVTNNKVSPTSTKVIGHYFAHMYDDGGFENGHVYDLFSRRGINTYDWYGGIRAFNGLSSHGVNGVTQRQADKGLFKRPLNTTSDKALIDIPLGVQLELYELDRLGVETIND